MPHLNFEIFLQLAFPPAKKLLIKIKLTCIFFVFKFYFHYGIAVDANGIYIQDFESARPGEKRFLCLRCGKYHTASEGCQ